MTAQSKINPAEYQKMMTALGYGFLNFGLYIQAQAQSSFLPSPPSSPGGPPAIRTGTMRRSAHTVAFVDGKPLGQHGDFPDYSGEITGIGVIVGYNSGYSIFLELGTVNMEPRPSLIPAALDAMGRQLELMGAGARAHYHAR